MLKFLNYIIINNCKINYNLSWKINIIFKLNLNDYEIYLKILLILYVLIYNIILIYYKQ